MEIDGQVLPYEEVIQRMNEDTIEVGCSIGLSGSRFQSGSSSRYVIIAVQVEPRKVIVILYRPKSKIRFEMIDLILDSFFC